ncbi:hypothetical protein GQ44DRAFT_717848 [Phaeosphaeriaceae sp. PMI808]|nr:hypothetical protein GQ44DRAFT_717848 [Phaeosphaeriaceae sp. PMI808]
MRTQVLNTLFTALDHDYLNVTNLRIDHLQDYTKGVYNTPAFQNVRKKLTQLHLKIVSESSEWKPEGDIDMNERHDFFNHELNKHWLIPLQNQLTNLTLFSNDFFGVYPRWDTRGLHFPHLQSLSLGMWSIAHDWQIEWLLSHANTLEELYLEECPIVNSTQNSNMGPDELSITNTYNNEGQFFPKLRWHTVLSLVSKRMKRLRRFSMVHGDSYSLSPPYAINRQSFPEHGVLPSRIVPGRYCVFDDGTLPSPWVQHFYRHGLSDEEMKRIEEEDESICGWMVDVDDEEEGYEGERVRLRYPQERGKDQMALDGLIAGLERKVGGERDEL